MNHSSQSPILDVLIAGAGPVGLTLAAEFVRWGVSFRIVDKKSGPEKYSKAANFWQRTREVAAAIGYGDRIDAHAIFPKGTTVNAFGKYIGHPTNAAPPTPTPFPQLVAVNQGQVEQTIVGYLAEHGVQPEYDTAALTCTQGDEHVQTVIEKGQQRETIYSRYVVACDGGKSAIREQAGITIEPRPLPNRKLQQVDARLR